MLQEKENSTENKITKLGQGMNSFYILLILTCPTSIYLIFYELKLRSCIFIGRFHFLRK